MEYCPEEKKKKSLKYAEKKEISITDACIAFYSLLITFMTLSSLM